MNYLSDRAGAKEDRKSGFAVEHALDSLHLGLPGKEIGKAGKGMLGTQLGPLAVLFKLFAGFLEQALRL